jgi:hypothetical protein
MYYLTEEDYARAASNGISRAMAYNRYYRCKGYDLERALTEPPGTYKRSTPNMQAWEEWAPIAELNGISRQCFYNRLNARKREWTPEEAARTPIGSTRFTRISPEIYALAEKNGIPIQTLRTRVSNQHWTPYRAATEKVRRKGAVDKWIENILIINA